MNSRFFLRFVLLFGVLVPLAALAKGQPEIRVTATAKDVQVLNPDGARHGARVNEVLREGCTLRTGVGSRAEITFADECVARLESNTALGFKGNGPIIDLKEGAILVQALRNASGAKIQIANFIAAIKDTTVVFESYPSHYKFLVLTGTGRLYRPAHLGDSILVEPGQLVFGRPDGPLTDPVDFDIGRYMKTCRFVVDFAPLRSAALIAGESEKQHLEKTKKNLIDTNLVIFGNGTLVSIVDPAKVEALDRATTAVPKAKPSSTLVSNDLGSIETLKPSKPTASPSPASDKPE
jgi:FecR protein